MSVEDIVEALHDLKNAVRDLWIAVILACVLMAIVLISSR